MSEFESLIHLASPGGCLCLWCPCCGWQTKTLHLQGEEVFYKTKTVGAGRWPGRGEVTWSPGHLVVYGFYGFYGFYGVHAKKYGG